MNRFGTSKYSLVYDADVDVCEVITKIAEESHAVYITNWRKLYDLGIDVLLVNVGYFTIVDGFKSRESWLNRMNSIFSILVRKYGMLKETLIDVLTYVWGLSFCPKDFRYKGKMKYKELRYYAYGYKSLFYSTFWTVMISVIFSACPFVLMNITGMIVLPHVSDYFLLWIIYIFLAFIFLGIFVYDPPKRLKAILLNTGIVMLANLLVIVYNYFSEFRDFSYLGYRQEILKESCIGDIAFLFCELICILLYFLYFYCCRELSFNSEWKEANKQI